LERGTCSYFDSLLCFFLVFLTHGQNILKKLTVKTKATLSFPYSHPPVHPSWTPGRREAQEVRPLRRHPVLPYSPPPPTRPGLLAAAKRVRCSIAARLAPWGFVSVGARDGFRSNTHGYEFGCHYLPHFISNSDTNTNIIEYEYKMDISNLDLHSNTYLIYSIES
jgi:hypothetical protein